MKHEIKFISGYNCMDFPCKFNKKCSPSNSHGKHGVDILFLVHGEKGAVQFKLSTGWSPYHSEVSSIGHREIKRTVGMEDCYPFPTDLGYHSYEPHYEGQTSMGKCSVLGDKECFYDGSSLKADDAYYVLVNCGEETLWKFLEDYYKCVFEKGEYPRVGEYGDLINLSEGK